MKITNLLFLLILLSFAISCTKDDEVNKPPVAEAGTPQTAQLPADSATLTGSGTDPDGNVTGYYWSKVSGPSIPAIHTPGQASTKVGGLKPGIYVFQLMVTDDDGASDYDTVSVTVLPSVLKTLTLQPGPADGNDSRIVAMQNCTSGNPLNNVGNDNFPDFPDLPIGAWTNSANGCATMQYRAFLKFTGLSAIPQTATILSAKLSLYATTVSASLPLGNSYYPGSPYNSSGTNDVWIKQAQASWTESTITWNNQPSTTEANKVAIAASTAQWAYSVPDIDVTEMVKSMVNTVNGNNGFQLMLQNESFYRSMVFASSDHSDATKRPKLVIEYRE